LKVDYSGVTGTYGSVDIPKYTKFKLKSYIRETTAAGSATSGNKVNSNYNLLNFKCETSSLTISTDLTGTTEIPYSVMQYQAVDYVNTVAWPWSTTETSYGYQFTPFVCSTGTKCCSTITYELSSTNTYPPTIVTNSGSTAW